MQFKQLLFTALVGISSQVASAQCADTANIYSFTYNGGRYEVIKEMKTWDSAAACAVRRGGVLAEINSQQEQDSVYYQVVNGAHISPTYTAVGDGGGAAYIWIGATDKATEGRWLWDGNNDGAGINFWNGEGDAGNGGGTAVSGAFWNWGGKHSGIAQEPDNYGSAQDGGAIALSSWPFGTPGEWNDIATSNTLYYIIEYRSGTSVTNIATERPVGVSPVPAKGIINLSGDFEEATLTTISGQLIAKAASGDHFINVTEFPKGIYLITFKLNSGAVVTQRCVLE